MELAAAFRRGEDYLARWDVVWRYRCLPVAVAVCWAVLLVQWWLGRDSADEGSAVGSVGAVLLLGGVWSVGAHGMAEQQAEPVDAAEARARHDRAVRTHRRAVGLSLLGSVWMLVVVFDSATLLVTSAVLIASFVRQSSARTRKAATLLAGHLDQVIALSSRPGRGRAFELERGAAVRALQISGASGIDTGLGVGWWGVAGLHPRTREAFAGAADGRTPVHPDVLVRLRWHRDALDGRLDAAA